MRLVGCISDPVLFSGHHQDQMPLLVRHRPGRTGGRKILVIESRVRKTTESVVIYQYASGYFNKLLTICGHLNKNRPAYYILVHMETHEGVAAEDSES
jgi:hypothetical protein